MTRDKIVQAICESAEANGGTPWGERMFFRETGLSRQVLHRAGFANYGEAKEAAGFARGVFGLTYSDDALLQPLATLTREKRRFPTSNEMRVAKYSGSMPSYDAYLRLSKKGPLRDLLLKWCDTRADFKDVGLLLRQDSTATKRQTKPPAHGRIVSGYVYLMRYGSTGRDYKIGCTDNVARRESQIDMMSPTDVRRVHAIETDDPRGIERYWLERFAAKRVKNKEIFRLSAEDVAAFRARKYQ